jgi:hypothetical protein
VVLLDAASSLTLEDLDLLRLLYEAGIPAQIVLSKADLLTPADRQKTASYVHEHIRHELGLDLAVHPVSTVGADELLLTQWFEREVEPLLVRHRSLTEASLQRKIAQLQESVAAVLQAQLARHEAGAPDGPAPADARPLRQCLEQADQAIRQAQLRYREWTSEARVLPEIVVNDAAQMIVNSAGKPGHEGDSPVLAVLQRVLAQRDQMAREMATTLQRTLVRNLESLQRLAPLAHPHATSLQDLEFRGLPAHDLAPLRASLRWRRPWWSYLIPGLAVWGIRRSLRERLGPTLREQFELHDRQLQAWLKACVGQVVELYEAQAEVFRQLGRRPTNDGAVAGDQLSELRSDLRDLLNHGSPPVEKAEAVATLHKDEG